MEVEAIGRVRHKNLVRLLGYCVEGAYRYVSILQSLLIFGNTYFSQFGFTMMEALIHIAVVFA